LPKIKYCCRNFKKGTDSVYQAMKEAFPELKHKKKDCLGECKTCSKGCIAMIGKKKLLCERSADDLYAALREVLKDGKSGIKSA
jgi:uncharacterized protein YuzB (UPF0349 family)